MRNGVRRVRPKATASKIKSYQLSPVQNCGTYASPARIQYPSVTGDAHRSADIATGYLQVHTRQSGAKRGHVVGLPVDLNAMRSRQKRKRKLALFHSYGDIGAVRSNSGDAGVWRQSNAVTVAPSTAIVELQIRACFERLPTSYSIPTSSIASVLPLAAAGREIFRTRVSPARGKYSKVQSPEQIDLRHNWLARRQKRSARSDLQWKIHTSLHGYPSLRSTPGRLYARVPIAS